MTAKFLLACLTLSLCAAGTAFSAGLEGEVMSERRAHSEEAKSRSTAEQKATDIVFEKDSYSASSSLALRSKN